MPLTWAATAQQHSPSSGYVQSNQNQNSGDAQRCERDRAACKCQVWKKATAAVIKCSEHSALGFGSYAPLRHSCRPWGSWWRWSWLSNLSSQCKRLLLQKREFKDLIAISISCPSQFLDLTEDISAAHLGWGEAEGDKHVTSLRQQMLREKMMICVPEQQSRSELCKQYLFQRQESNPSWKVYASCGSEVTLEIKCLLEGV